MSSYLDALKWRYATKKFDSSKKLSAEQVAELKEVLRLSASSYGLQPYVFVEVVDPEIRKQLQEHAWGQSQVVDASNLFVLCAKTTTTAGDVDAYVANMAETRGVPESELAGFGDMMKGSVVKGMDQEMQEGWAAKQVYLALGNLLSACAVLEIDSCPMEGFVGEKFDEILGLKEKGLKTVVLCPVGYRDESDDMQSMAKVRKAAEDIFMEI